MEENENNTKDMQGDDTAKVSIEKSEESEESEKFEDEISQNDEVVKVENSDVNNQAEASKSAELLEKIEQLTSRLAEVENEYKKITKQREEELVIQKEKEVKDTFFRAGIENQKMINMLYNEYIESKKNIDDYMSDISKDDDYSMFFASRKPSADFAPATSKSGSMSHIEIAKKMVFGSPRDEAEAKKMISKMSETSSQEIYTLAREMIKNNK
jgi:hypothetical protein